MRVIALQSCIGQGGCKVRGQRADAPASQVEHAHHQCLKPEKQSCKGQGAALEAAELCLACLAVGCCRLACAHGAQPSLPHAAPAAVSKPKRPEGAAQLQPAGGHVLQMAAAAVTQQPARPDVNDKLKRAEQRRKEEEERRRAELEARQKVKEDRTKAARQAAASAVASKAEASRLEPGTRPGAGAGGAAGAGPAGGEAGAAGAAGRGAGAGMQTAGGKAGGPLQARNMNIPTLAAGAGGTGAASKKEAGATAIAPGLTKGPAATAAPTAAATSAATAGVVATASACTTTPGAVRRAQDGEVQFKTVVKVLAQPQPPPATPAELVSTIELETLVGA